MAHKQRWNQDALLATKEVEEVGIFQLVSS